VISPNPSLRSGLLLIPTLSESFEDFKMRTRKIQQVVYDEIRRLHRHISIRDLKQLKEQIEQHRELIQQMVYLRESIEKIHIPEVSTFGICFWLWLIAVTLGVIASVIS